MKHPKKTERKAQAKLGRLRRELNSVVRVWRKLSKSYGVAESGTTLGMSGSYAHSLRLATCADLIEAVVQASRKS